MIVFRSWIVGRASCTSGRSSRRKGASCLVPGFDTATSLSRSSRVARRFTKVVLAFRSVSGSSSSARSREAFSWAIAPKVAFVLVTRPARSSRRSASAVTVVAPSFTKRSSTAWSSASSLVTSLVDTRKGEKYLVACARLLALAVVLVAEPADHVPEAAPGPGVQRVEERVDVHRRAGVVGVDLAAVVDLLARCSAPAGAIRSGWRSPRARWRGWWPRCPRGGARSRRPASA